MAEDGEEDDYMGDLSLFLEPQEILKSTQISVSRSLHLSMHSSVLFLMYDTFPLPLARIAMSVLCISVCLFFYFFACLFSAFCTCIFICLSFWSDIVL